MAQMNFREKLESGKFVYTAEITSPKGIDLSYTLEKAELLSEKIDAFNLTDNARAIMKISSIGACKILQEKGFETIFQISGKDRNSIAIQSDLLAASAQGLHNCIAITGDPPQLGDHPNAKKVFELDSIHILKAINSLNNGFDLAEKPLNGKTNFFAGATFNPSNPNIPRTEKKAEAGAKFFQTQMVFDSKKFIEYLEKIKHLNAKILEGIMPLNSYKMAEFLNSKISGIKVPEHILKEIKDSQNPKKTGIEIAKQTIDEIKKHCDGIHFMPLKHEDSIMEIL